MKLAKHRETRREGYGDSNVMKLVESCGFVWLPLEMGTPMLGGGTD